MCPLSIATVVVQLQHLKYNILVLRLTVGVLEQKKGKGYSVTIKHAQQSAWLHFNCAGQTRGKLLRSVDSH